ncbi:MAG: hypothetical protein EOS20_17310 [Mesorhizobium sp.]|uniref:hypothetical protein n=1 Tax=Mesorhizobium sp. TaxID=1871066 RepID=UPI000FE50C62|nr:hypothetical protein [Mesorhizobium sp.]RWQ35832.1 MAG: hypothetical protein EOS20_17310 [Mesorhizobium sp.]
MNLTTKRLDALKAIAEVPGKSGAFWRGLGIAPATLAALERDGLAEGVAVDPMASTPLRQQWRATDEGKRQLPYLSEPF